MSKRQAACYLRVSTSEQVRDGFSLAAQKEKCELLAKLKGIDEIVEYTDPGISGSRDDRPAYQRLISDIEKGLVGTIFIWRIDRLSRNLRSFLDFMDLLNKEGVELISVSESIDTTTSAGRLMLKNLMSFSEYFLEVLSENIKSGLEKRVNGGGWITTAPTGADLIEGKIVWNGKSNEVKRAFEMAAEGASYSAISKATGLNQNSLWYVLRNPVYIGQITMKGEVYKGEHEHLISRELFERVQEVKAPIERSWKKQASHPLSGFVRCADCGRAMTVYYSGVSNGSVLSYVCKHRSGQACEGVGSRAAVKVERALLGGLRLLKESEALRQEISDYWNSQETPKLVEIQIKKTEGELAEVKRKRDKMARLILEDGIDEDDFKEIKSELVQREKQLAKELDAFRNLATESERHSESLEELLEVLDRVNIEDIWNEATDLERKWILDDFLKSIVVHKEYAEIQLYDVPTFKVDWSEVDGRRKLRSLMERETGLEPATFSLGS